MRELLTPKEVARAIDVSESSVKRWCDKGSIPTQYTPGGHRRITMAGLIGFLRDSRHQLVHPEALGLPATIGQTARVIDRARDQLTDALAAGDEPRCRQIAIDLNTDCFERCAHASGVILGTIRRVDEQSIIE